MTPLNAALDYAARGWSVFPCREIEPRRKQPRTVHGHCDATTDPDRILAWWETWPDALIGAPTGGAIGVVLDIDIKDPAADGWDTLGDLGYLPLPDTRITHTASGGIHLGFAASDRELRCSAGLIGPGLDVCATGGYVILPSPGSGYTWDPVLGVDTPLAPAPAWLWPHIPERVPLPRGRPIGPVAGLDRYGAAAIERACEAIVTASQGQQERVLNAEAFSIGSLAGAGAVPATIALAALLRAAASMPSYDARFPWRAAEIDQKVRRAFAHGANRPREARHAVA